MILLTTAVLEAAPVVSINGAACYPRHIYCQELRGPQFDE